MKKRPQQINHNKKTFISSWTLIFWLLCFTLLVGNIILILLVLPGSGWDFRVNISAVIAVIMQMNPYDPKLISQISQIPDIPFGYPPYVLAFFYFLSLPGFFYIYYPIWAVFLFASYYVMTRVDAGNRVYLISLFVSGFISIFWSFLTGNQGAIYLFLMSLVFYFIIIKKEYLSSVCLGLVAAFNMFPLVFSVIYLFLKKEFKKRLKIIAFSIITVLALFILSALITPEIFKQYITMMSSGMPWEGAGGAVPIAFYINTPTSYWLINQILKPVGLQDSVFFFVLCIGYLALIGKMWYSFYRENKDSELMVISFAMIAIFLVLPRLKPYYFTYILVPLYFMTRAYEVRRKVVILSLASLLPLILFFLYQFSQNIITSFGQLWACLAVFIVIFLYSREDSSSRHNAGKA